MCIKIPSLKFDVRLNFEIYGYISAGEVRQLEILVSCVLIAPAKLTFYAGKVLFSNVR